jgi:hypothetical protein
MVAPAVLEDVVNVYGAVPPDAEKVPEAVASPKQARVTSAVLASVRTDGSDKVIEMDDVHPFASVTVTVYIPAFSAEISSIAEVNAEGPVHAYVYGASPPDTVRLMDPSDAPLQVILYPPAKVAAEYVRDNAGCTVIRILEVVVQPFLSVTNTV